MSSDSSASPGLRLPGLLHFREGSTPLAVVATRPQPDRRMLPWNTCGDTQGSVRKPIQPSSTECNFTSRLTKKLTHSRVSAGNESEGSKRRTGRNKTEASTAVACSALVGPYDHRKTPVFHTRRNSNQKYAAMAEKSNSKSKTSKTRIMPPDSIMNEESERRQNTK